MSPEFRRASAARWFMCAAAIPCGLILAAVLIGEWLNSMFEVLFYVLVVGAVPVHIARGWGASLGAAILNPAATRGAGEAALRGVAVAGASFGTYLFALSLCVASFSARPGEDFLKYLIMFTVGGTILVGWLVAAVGALAGVMLYKKTESELINVRG
jgi:hypothetical protein